MYWSYALALAILALTIVVTGFIAYKACKANSATSSSSDAGSGALVMALIFGVLCPVSFYALMSEAVDVGKPAVIKVGVAYDVSSAYNAAGKNEPSVILELRTDRTALGYRYFYLVSCAALRNGCPDAWPKKFVAVQDGSFLKIVPLTAEEKK